MTLKKTCSLRSPSHYSQLPFQTQLHFFFHCNHILIVYRTMEIGKIIFNFISTEFHQMQQIGVYIFSSVQLYFDFLFTIVKFPQVCLPKKEISRFCFYFRIIALCRFARCQPQAILVTLKIGRMLVLQSIPFLWGRSSFSKPSTRSLFQTVQGHLQNIPQVM